MRILMVLLVGLTAVLSGIMTAGAGETFSAQRAYEQAVRLFENDEHERVLDMAERGLENDPRFLPLWRLRAAAHLALRNYPAAREAAKVCLAGDPEDTECLDLAFRACLDDAELDSETRGDILRGIVSEAGSAAFAALLLEWFQDSETFFLDSDDVFSMWDTTTILPASILTILRRYRDGELIAASDLLRKTEKSDHPHGVGDGLQYLIGRGMVLNGHPRDAIPFLEQAIDSGFAVAKAVEYLALAHRELGDRAKAADVALPLWRQTADPGKTVSNIASDLIAAGRADDAVDLLRQTASAFPRLPSHHARHMLALHVLGKEKELDRYIIERTECGDLAGIGYGRALIARFENDLPQAEKELASVRTHARSELGNSLDRRGTEDWLEFGHMPGYGEQRQALEKRFADAGILWERGALHAAISMQSDAASRGLPGARHRILDVVFLLAEKEMGLQALTLLRRHLPDVRLIDAAAMLEERNRWSAMANLFKAEKSPETEGSAWEALYRTRAALFAGTDDELVAESLRYLGTWQPQPEELLLRSIDESDALTFRLTSSEEYHSAMQQVVAQVIARRDDGLLGILRSSRQWGAGAELGIVQIGERLMLAGRRDEARLFFTAAIQAGGAHPAAEFGLARLEEREGQANAARVRIASSLPGTEGVLRERLLALRAKLDSDGESVAEHLGKALTYDAENADLRLETIRALVTVHRYNEAAALMEPLDVLRLQGDTDALFHLAHANVDLGRFDEAVVLWRMLRKRFPRSLPATAGLGRTLNLMNKPQMTIDELAETARSQPTVELCALMAEAHLALAQYEDTLEWVEAGLLLDSDNLRLIGSGVRAAEGRQRPDEIEQYARRYITIDPYSSTMHIMYGQALVDQKKWWKVYHHSSQLHAYNQYNWAALERELERRNACEDPLCSWATDRYIAEHFGNNAVHTLRIGVRAAGLGKYHRDDFHAFPALERLHSYGPNGAALTLFYSGISVGRRLGAVRFDVLRSHLDALAGNYRLEGVEALRVVPDPDEQPRQVPLVLVIGRSPESDLLVVDAHLADMGGRAALIVGEESFRLGTPMWADAGVLSRLAESGRWEFLLTDYSPTRLEGEVDGQRTDFWTERKWLGDRPETPDEMRVRFTDELIRLKQLAHSAGIPLSGWVHPSWGDYGQRVIRGDVAAMQTYLDAVGEVFPLALTHTPGGFTVPETDPLRTPMRTVGAAVEACELRTALQYQHPTRRAALELAKAKSWNGQHPEAHRLFNNARLYGADPREISYFQGRNSQYQADVPCAVAFAHEAWSLDPYTTRTAALIKDTHRFLRPLLTPSIRHWSDSRHEKYTEAGTEFSFHLNPKWELRMKAGYHTWEGSDGESLHGTSAGLGIRHYFRPQNWWLAEVRGVAVGGGAGSFPEARAMWHGAFDLKSLKINGTFDFAYNREGIETRDAVAAGIRANRFSADTNFRFRNVWDVDLNSYFTNRTDGNNTWSAMFRPTYRFSEMPQIRAGYWFAMADSDHNPEEYYAPVQYMAHQAVVMYRQDINDCWSIRALASYGKAKAKGTDWRNVLRANAGITYRPNECVSISAGYNHLKLPDYTLNSFNISVGIRF